MIAWSVLDTAKVPGGCDELRLMKRGSEFSIKLGQLELMSSRVTGSEQALASLTCLRIRGRQRPRLLVGGLGMGFTLRAALAELGPDARIVVAELVPAVVDWARGPLAELFGESLSDERVRIHITDVARLIQAGRSTYDAILLDVDNGPEGVSRAANDALYSFEGLRAAKSALRPGGVLAVWSSGPNKNFARRFQQSGFAVADVAVRANSGRRGAHHVIWIGTKHSSAPPARAKTARPSSASCPS